MRDKDVILVANSDGAQLLKFFTLVRGVTGIISDIKSISSSSTTTTTSSNANTNNTGLASTTPSASAAPAVTQ